MAVFRMLCGPPGSGKSTLSNTLEGNVLSSDEIRRIISGSYDNFDHDQIVFDYIHQKAKELLMNDEDVIIDATNLSRKKRVHFLKLIKKLDVKKEIYFFEHSLETCLKQNFQRSPEKHVPKKRLIEMYNATQVPLSAEGWDKIYVCSEEDDTVYGEVDNVDDKRQSFIDLVTNNADHDDLFNQLSSYCSSFDNIFNLAQDSTYHSFSVSRHTFYVWDYVRSETDDLSIIIAALFHDIGKYETKSFYNFKGEKKRYANFIGHENVSTKIAFQFLRNIGFDQVFIQKTLLLIQYHMTLHKVSSSENPESTFQKVCDRLEKNGLDKDDINKLCLLHKADQQGK